MGDRQFPARGAWTHDRVDGHARQQGDDQDVAEETDTQRPQIIEVFYIPASELRGDDDEAREESDDARQNRSAQTALDAQDPPRKPTDENQQD